MENILPVAPQILSSTPVRWKSLVRTTPMDLLNRQPAPKEWSAVECLKHILDTEKYVFPVRIKAFLAGENFPAFNPDAAENQASGGFDAMAMIKDFNTLRMANLKLLLTVKTDDLFRSAIHGQLGKVTLSEMVHEWAGHDLMHTVQAERAILQPFILGCGPWRPYFKDHDATKD